MFLETRTTLFIFGNEDYAKIMFAIFATEAFEFE
jgi:hypothetical protein